MNKVLDKLPYEIEKPLIGGRFSDVYLARDAGMRVVVKVARDQPKEAAGATNGVFFAQGQWMVTGGNVDWVPEANEILFQEAEALARVKHPAMVKLLNKGQVDGRAYLVLEYIEGQTWRAALSQNQVELHHYLKLARTLAKVNRELGYHGDIKPDNLILQPSGETRIIDPSSFMTKLGANGLPEQILTSEAYNPLLKDSDVPAMGLILMELLCGRPLFLEAREAKQTRETGPILRDTLKTAKIIGQHDRYARLLSMPLPREIKATIPTILQTIALKCIGLEWSNESFELSTPYTDVAAVAAAIEKFLS